ncbi:MAG: thioredoxin domain-containing protein [Smithella sp.]
MKSDKKNPNLLIHEKSPYLLQHAYNPVQWHPWAKEAFEKAMREDKLVFLSIGYSTCHWCHVMAHESFEDMEVARLLNKYFVCIKVDREERPDIDKIYMTACQAFTGRGGWPLTIFMTPQRQPVYGATYIPKESRPGLIGMLDLLPQIQEIWKNKREEVLIAANHVISIIGKTDDRFADEISKKDLTIVFQQLAAEFDKTYGGFGPAPKFPMPHQIMFLLRYSIWSGDKKAVEMVSKTLDLMGSGGIYDQLGFGSHRYSTDEKWLVPHFEKMLYDQALLSMAYAEAYGMLGFPGYREKAAEIFRYVLRDMTSTDGGFYSAEDADSEDEEGKFYLWTRNEIEQTLSLEEAKLIANIYNIEKEGNYFEPLTGSKSGRNILHLKKSWPEIASSLGLSEEELRRRAKELQEKLYLAREKRIHPHKDDKILTDWNGLMIAALAVGSRLLRENIYLEAALRALDFIIKNMQKADGGLLHRYRDGEAAIDANLDDYSFLIWGLIESYEASLDERWLQKALELNDYLTEHFCDEKSSGFYFSADFRTDLIVRQKDSYDGALPSGNSVMLLNLLRLSRITGNSKLEDTARRINQAFAASVRQNPAAHTQFMTGLGFAEIPSFEIVVVGKRSDANTKLMLDELKCRFLPNAVVIFRPDDEPDAAITHIAPFTKDMKSIDGKATAYVCSNFTCSKPTTDIEEMLALLNTQNLSDVNRSRY